MLLLDPISCTSFQFVYHCIFISHNDLIYYQFIFIFFFLLRTSSNFGFRRFIPLCKSVPSLKNGKIKSNTFNNFLSSASPFHPKGTKH